MRFRYGSVISAIEDGDGMTRDSDMKVVISHKDEGNIMMKV